MQTLDDPEYYSTPAAMTRLPAEIDRDSLPTNVRDVRAVATSLLVHRDLVGLYGLKPSPDRLEEQHLRSTEAIFARAAAIDNEQGAKPAVLSTERAPQDRVVSICRDFALVETALLRATGVPARVRCGFANYFERGRWTDHWITERWDDGRWVRDDPQIDALQRSTFGLDFDPHDQPPGHFLDASQAWIGAREGTYDASRFGIFDMWGLSFIAGNVLADIACLAKTEMLPWDGWGVGLTFGPFDDLPADLLARLDRLAQMVVSGEIEQVRAEVASHDDLRVGDEIVTFIDGRAEAVQVGLASRP